MSTKRLIETRLLFLSLSTLLSTLGLSACGGGSTSSSTSAPPTYTAPAQPAVGTIASATAAAVAEPYLTGSTVMHYCDCQTGNTVQPAAGCVAGSDTTGDGSAANPFRKVGYPSFSQTTTYAAGDKVSFIGADYVSLTSGNTGNYPNSLGTNWQYINPGSHAVAAATWLGSRTAGNNTVALCQGGVWNAPAGQYALNLSGNTYCPDGQTCSEFREYTAGWGGGGTKPVIYGQNAASAYLFFLGNGQRIMNLSLIGSGTGSNSDQQAFFLYKWVPSGVNPGIHDDTIWNVDMDGFDLAVHDATNENNNITVKGNHISNSVSFAFLGASSNLNVNYNYFHNNGGDNMFDHTIYFGSHSPVTGVNAIGNYMDGFSSTTGATSCLGGPFVIHGEYNDLVVSGNTIIEDPNATGPGCWGLSANHGGYTLGAYIHHGRFSDNIVINGGNQGMGVDNCPDCVIENNLIIQDSANNGGIGIHVPSFGAHRTAGSIANCTTTNGNTCADELSTRYIIRNNTIYFTANAGNGMTGIRVDTEGTGYEIYNNTIRYDATGHQLNLVACFNLPLALSTYSIVDNNNCSAADSALLWEGSRRASLADWIAQGAASGYNFDSTNSAAISGANPGFSLSAYPYFTWSDSAMAYALLNNGTTNVFTPSGSLAGAGRSGPAQDITGTARANPPAVGAYQ